MQVEMITKEDLREFREQLLNDLKYLLVVSSKSSEKPWLKSCEVRKMLGISSNTLQNLRVTGKLRPTKVGGIFYYSLEEINGMLGQNGHCTNDKQSGQK